MMNNLIKTDSLEHHSTLSWSDRFHRAMDRYSAIKGIQPSLIPALITGLHEWADHLPYSSRDSNGCHLPVNTWGLGAEYTEIYAFVDWLILENRLRLADSLRKKFETVYRSASELDEVYPKTNSQDEATEKRLVQMCCRQTEQLIEFLEGLLRVVFKSSSKIRLIGNEGIPVDRAPVTNRKRLQRASDIEMLEKALIAHIHSARDYAWAAIHAGKSPALLPRPKIIHLAKETGIHKWSVGRCLRDAHAKKLKLLWDMANDLEQILRFTKK